MSNLEKATEVEIKLIRNENKQNIEERQLLIDLRMRDGLPGAAATLRESPLTLAVEPRIQGMLGTKATYP